MLIHYFGLFNVFESCSVGLSLVVPFIQVGVVCLHILCDLPRSPFFSKLSMSGEKAPLNCELFAAVPFMLV